VPPFAIGAATFAVSAAALWLFAPAAAVHQPQQRSRRRKAAKRGGGDLWRLLRGSVFFRRVLLIAVLANLTFAGTFRSRCPRWRTRTTERLAPPVAAGASRMAARYAARRRPARPMVVAPAAASGPGVVG
jgi:hypothetical protein